jgi:hypothetical protein
MIGATTRIDLPTMCEGRRWHWRASGPLRLLAPALGVLHLGVGVALMSSGESGRVLPALFLVFGCYLVMRQALLGIRFRGQVKAMPQYGQPMVWRLGEGRVEIDVGESRSSVSYDDFWKIGVTPAGILFYPQKEQYLWLPRGAFARAEDFERVVVEVRGGEAGG